MTDVSEFEDVVENFMAKDEFKECLDYIETKIDPHVVLTNTYLFENKLICLYDLNRKADAFKEAKAYHAKYLPLTAIVCIALGNGYNDEGNYTEAYFFFSQFDFDDKAATLSRLAEWIEHEARKKFDEGKYKECLDYIKTIRLDISEDVFDCKIKCLIELNKKKEALAEGKSRLESGGVLSYSSFGILGSILANMGNYNEAREHFQKAIMSCRTKEEKLRYRDLLKSMEKEERRKEDKRVAKIDPTFLKGGNKRSQKKTSKSTKKNIKQKEEVSEKKNEESQLQKGDSYTKEMEVETIIAEEKSDLIGESGKEKDVEKIDEISVKNEKFSTIVRYSVVEHHSDTNIVDVIKEDYFMKTPISLVKASEKHLENLDLLKSWGYKNPFMAIVDGAVPSYSFSSYPDPMLVVERIQPLHVFFTSKREEFMKIHSSSTSKERDWWTCIKENFRLIFRDIICGLFFLHSSNHACSGFYDSLYVNKEGRGKILHNFAKKFTYSQAQQDVKDLVMLIEYVITGSTCQQVDGKDLKCHFETIKDNYNLPEELHHFLLLLNTRKENISICKLPSTWLIDHPYFWDDKHGIRFLEVLKDLIREDMISESAFDNWSQFETWFSQIENDIADRICLK
ncbi:uncharacterized protein LOC130827108 isoform X1 [Amaranthus tricolor]|uniref:uncharacterized protein LOC130827108 isoform X1 n=1 Tax=Amaranthus tricolor TaxID=29722 RepID=UPI00258BF560|nr:uncharacterized protein LOC130827108 isoform X1 [Amaranthus tricolor]